MPTSFSWLCNQNVMLWYQTDHFELFEHKTIAALYLARTLNQVSSPPLYLNNQDQKPLIRAHKPCSITSGQNKPFPWINMKFKSMYALLTSSGGFCLGCTLSKVLLCNTNKADSGSVMSWETASHSLVSGGWSVTALVLFFDRALKIHVRSAQPGRERTTEYRRTVCSDKLMARACVFSDNIPCEHFIYFHADVPGLTNTVARCLPSCMFNNALLFGGFSSTSQLSSSGLDSVP